MIFKHCVVEEIVVARREADKKTLFPHRLTRCEVES